MQKANYAVTHSHSRMQNTNPHELHVIWINKHADFVGGAERYIHDTVKALAEKGVKSTLLYQLDGKIHPRFTHVFNSVYPITELKTQLKNQAATLIYLHQLDHVQDIETCVQSGIPSIRFYHDHKLFCLREHKYTTIGLNTCQQKTGPACYACLGFIGRNTQHKLTLNRLGNLRAHQHSNQTLAGFIVGSQYMSQVLKQHEFEVNKTHVIPLFTTSNISIIKPSQPRNSNQLLYVGSLMRGKGVDLLLRAIARQNKQANLLICGEGPQKEELQQLSQKLGIETRVEFKGQCNTATLAKYYQQASALVIPSRTPETFCLTGIEALSYACPVIAASVGAIPEWLQDGVNGRLVDSNNVFALSDAIRKQLLHPKTIQRHALHTQKVIMQQYSIKAHINQLLQVFDHVLKGNSSHTITARSMTEGSSHVNH
ncbi:glycosyltransferase family 4 protein [Shewanella psychropiezotolerans]|uniref:Glycosyltransferase family 4 protein n=1 Tax=Shewanella psychropiezotolerans TaxID=2593655 RepID=A0ABX5WWV9_9GAMM|nr:MULTISPECIES: glycosyltransferase family 4 protein [Shewanella]MPY26054.1 glycosyltransferase family 4 protein [Shewanella sp. YLB-07]QDO83579.1 glycosyltransferase family 4 protein [Shewanella psychropiezotolerans]